MSNQPRISLSAIVEKLALRPHPEGGFYRETYRSKVSLPGGVAGSKRSRAAGTAILFLLPEGSCSLFHRLKTDEIWHFYLGGPLVLVELRETGEMARIAVGPDLLAGQELQHVVPAGRWFGAYPAPGSGFSLVGCTVAPGFEFEDLEFGLRDDLLSRFPAAQEEILRLTEQRASSK
jgi:uncharacterized protein